MSLLNSIQQYPMQFMMPSFSPALSSNPEIAKAAQYGGGGGGGGGAAQSQAAPAGNAPAAGLPDTPGSTAGLTGSTGGGSGIMAQIMKLLGSSGSGGGPEAILSMLAGL